MSTSPQVSCSAGRQRQPARSARSAPAAKGRILGVGRCPFSCSHVDALAAAYFALFHAPGAIMILAGVRGGLTSKIHALVDVNGLSIRLAVTPGQAHDNRLAGKLLSRLAT